MRKIKYLFRRIIELDYKNMIKIAKNISKKSKKLRIFILFDMVICGFKYQAGYYDYQEFEFYNLNRKQRKTFLTRGINNEIVRLYNNKEYYCKFDNKDEFNKIFDKYLKRNWMILDNDYAKFETFIENNNSIIVKPLDGEGGFGIDKINTDNKTNIKELYTKLLKNKQLLIEECVKQHKKLNKLYDGSVNTLRMFTFCKEGKSYFLQALLKIGNGGFVDNFASGGMYTFLDDSGEVVVPAIDKADNIIYEHPSSKEQIVGFKVPMFKEAIDLVCEAAKEVKEIGYVGWDVAITDKGPLIIEGNCFPGVFQIKASLNKKKEGVLPKYKQVMKELH